MLKENLDFEQLNIQDLNAGEVLITIPISLDLIIENNKNLHPANYLLLIMDNAKQIRKGNIVQFVAGSNYISKKLPYNLFHNYYNLKNIEISGTITFLNVAGDMQYETRYENGKLLSHSIIQQKIQSSGRGNSISQQCYDVWFVTWYINGTSTWEYMYSFCLEGGEGQQQCRGAINTAGRNIQVECGGGGGSGGGTPAEVVNQLTNPCKIAALNAITQTGVNNLISDFYNGSILPSHAPITLLINEFPISIPGHTQHLGNNVWAMTLNNGPGYENPTMSQEAWGAIIAHEILHIYLENQDVIAMISNNTYHHSIIFSRFVNTISSLLQTSFGINQQDGVKLALSGLGDLWGNRFGASSFDQLCLSLYGYTRQDINITMASYTIGTAGTRCN